jgi:hypothetical protein
MRTVELVKRVYLVEAYSKSEAYDKLFEMGPDQAVEVEVLGDHIFHEEIINEYEYNKEWKPLDPDLGPDQLKDQQKDWVDQGKLGTTGDRLQGPALNLIKDDSYDLYRDD